MTIDGLAPPSIPSDRRSDADTAGNGTDPGFAVYVHWPFCLSKCPYCDFNSHVVRDLDAAGWAAALTRELGHMRGLTGLRQVDSIFFGGGTPSLMPAETVEAVLNAVARLWTVAGDVEISLEANPTSVEADRFRAYASAGVNRLSLGVQALDDAALKFLGRLHTSAEALAALDVAQATCARVSADLIYARPDQTVDAWMDELERILARGLEHLSLYQLTIEEGTPFAALHRAGALQMPDEDASAALYRATQELCDTAGLRAYEVSNHARPGAECRHNLVYWRYGDYVGAGPGAHGRLAIDGAKVATRTLAAPEAWREAVEAQGHGIEEPAPIARADQGDEMMLMGLRLAEGVSRRRYEKLSRRMIDEKKLAALEAGGLIACESDCIRATPNGRLVLNRLVADLLGY